jgi:hypothetical protein
MKMQDVIIDKEATFSYIGYFYSSYCIGGTCKILDMNETMYLVKILTSTTERFEVGKMYVLPANCHVMQIKE